MNTIELKITEEDNEFWLKLFVDSKPVLQEEALVCEELVESFKGSGKYLIFTCSCGVADCGGWDKISVEHTDSSVKWKFGYGNINYEFDFEKLYYKGEIERVAWELKNRNIELSPKYLFYPE